MRKAFKESDSDSDEDSDDDWSGGGGRRNTKKYNLRSKNRMNKKEIKKVQNV